MTCKAPWWSLHRKRLLLICVLSQMITCSWVPKDSGHRSRPMPTSHGAATLRGLPSFLYSFHERTRQASALFAPDPVSATGPHAYDPACASHRKALCAAKSRSIETFAPEYLLVFSVGFSSGVKCLSMWLYSRITGHRVFGYLTMTQTRPVFCMIVARCASGTLLFILPP